MRSSALALVEAAGIGALAAGVALGGEGGTPSWGEIGAAATAASLLTPACLAGFYYAGLYDPERRGGGHTLGGHLARWIAVTTAAVIGLWTALPSGFTSVETLAWTLALLIAVVLPVRAGWLGLLHGRALRQRVIVLGTGPLARAVLAAMPPSAGTIGVVSDGAEAPDRLRHPRLGSLTQLDVILDRVRPHRIVVAVTERRGRLAVQRLLEARARGVVVEDGVEVYERLAGKLAIESLAPSQLLFGRGFESSHVHLAIARLVSMVCAAAGLLLLSPVMAVVALLVKLDSRGPVLFVHERVGLHARPFALLKFRTMIEVSHGTTEWVRDNTDRITRVGKWLRKFRLDELPQFINILRGDMNLVGPRPHPVTNFELFAREIPFYSLRAMVRPGVTGWAQVRYGYANCLEEEIEKMRYDLYYIKHRSLAFDLRILFDTVKVVLLGLGATTVHGRGGDDRSVRRLRLSGGRQRLNVG